jgi:hypothetical protein
MNTSLISVHGKRMKKYPNITIQKGFLKKCRCGKKYKRCTMFGVAPNSVDMSKTMFGAFIYWNYLI